MAFLIEPLSSSPAAHRAGAAGRLDLPTPPPRVPPNKRVRTCYTLVHAAEAVGIRDLADGEYLPTPTRRSKKASSGRLNYLLDEVGCTRPGFRLLEIGCGYGHLLRKLAKERGAMAVGVNISPEQVRLLQSTACRCTAATIATYWRRLSGTASSTA